MGGFPLLQLATQYYYYLVAYHVKFHGLGIKVTPVLFRYLITRLKVNMIRSKSTYEPHNCIVITSKFQKTSTVSIFLPPFQICKHESFKNDFKIPSSGLLIYAIEKALGISTLTRSIPHSVLPSSWYCCFSMLPQRCLKKSKVAVVYLSSGSRKRTFGQLLR